MTHRIDEFAELRYQISCLGVVYDLAWRNYRNKWYQSLVEAMRKIIWRCEDHARRVPGNVR